MKLLTWVEGDFTDHDPLGGEVKLEFDKPADSSMEFDGHVAIVLEDPVLHVCEWYGVTVVVLTTNGKPDLHLGEHLKQERQNGDVHNIEIYSPFNFSYDVILKFVQVNSFTTHLLRS